MKSCIPAFVENLYLKNLHLKFARFLFEVFSLERLKQKFLGKIGEAPVFILAKLEEKTVLLFVDFFFFEKLGKRSVEFAETVMEVPGVENAGDLVLDEIGRSLRAVENPEEPCAVVQQKKNLKSVPVRFRGAANFGDVVVTQHFFALLFSGLLELLGHFGIPNSVFGQIYLEFFKL
jgi:hypothetical protein